MERIIDGVTLVFSCDWLYFFIACGPTDPGYMCEDNNNKSFFFSSDLIKTQYVEMH